MFAMTYPSFIDISRFVVHTSYNSTALMEASTFSLIANFAVFMYMIYKVMKTKRNPYTSELYTDLSCYKEVKQDAMPV